MFKAWDAWIDFLDHKFWSISVFRLRGITRLRHGLARKHDWSTRLLSHPFKFLPSAFPACVFGEFAVVYSPVKFICDHGKEAEKKD